MSKKNPFNRRLFLKGSVAGLAALGLRAAPLAAGREEQQENPPPAIKSFRTLGRTGFKVSDISSGTFGNPMILEALLDAGVNYIDTAESYGNQKSIGTVLAKLDRKKIFITSKMIMENDISREGLLNRARKCLEELQTDYLDCMMVHSPESLEIMRTPTFFEAMDQLRREGRVKYLGVSHHGSNWLRDEKVSMETMLLAAVEDGRFDVFLLAYNFLQMDMGDKVLAACREKGVGTTLMKVNPVGNYLGIKTRIEQWREEGRDIHPLYIEGLERYSEKARLAEPFIDKYNLKKPEEIRAAAVRFCLANPDVNTVCLSIRNFADMEQMLALSGSVPAERDEILLGAFQEGCGQLYCRHACNTCEAYCPQQVPVNRILRYNHYFEAQGREKFAMSKYARLKNHNASACLQCSGVCEKHCPHQLPVQGMLSTAHLRLSLA